jgi:hypothetical protein
MSSVWILQAIDENAEPCRTGCWWIAGVYEKYFDAQEAAASLASSCDEKGCKVRVRIEHHTVE